MEVYTRRTSSFFSTSPVLMLLALSLFAALLNGARNLIVLSLLVIVMAATLKLWARASASKIEHSLFLDKERAFPGEPLTLTLSVENKKPLPLCLEVHVPVDPSLSPTAEAAVDEDDTLLWFQATVMKWELRAMRRGVYMIGPATISTGDVLGFFMKEGRETKRHRVVVYPSIVPLGPFSLPGREFFGVPGGRSPVEDPVYILGCVNYQHGRPARHIHWKASARHHLLQQKVFEPTQQEKLLLIVDVESFAEQGADDAFERTLEVVGSLALQLDRRGCAVGFLSNGATEGTLPMVATARGPLQTGAILEALARLRMERAQPFSSLLKGSRASLSWGMTCACFSLESSGESEYLAAHFSRQRIPYSLYTYPEIMRLPGCNGLREGNGPIPSRQAVFVP